MVGSCTGDRAHQAKRILIFAFIMYHLETPKAKKQFFTDPYKTLAILGVDPEEVKKKLVSTGSERFLS